MKLIVDGIERQVGADWSLRFVEEVPVKPVLYYKGKRVTKAWRLVLDYDSPVDPHDNANTAEIPPLDGCGGEGNAKTG
jgi:hypothetical protein